MRWSWNAAIHAIAKFRPEQYCGGALISDHHVLTAAHCIEKRTSDGIRVHLGSRRRSTLDKGELAMSVKEMCIHQNYSGSVSEHLHRLLTKTEKISFSNARFRISVVYVKLAKKTQKHKFSRTLFHVVPQFDTQEFIGKAHGLLSKNKCLKYFDITLSDEVLCAPHDGGSLCEGDSGAPVMQNIGGHWFLQGVLSGGPPKCGDSTLPMVFTRVASFMDNFINPYLKAKTRETKKKFCTLK
ncbi:hypothetical protein HPB50_019136 [Hyalomma asiaticum]|uniref:Uncharacterized protein n=1 Tax=Hyalomma asiaticum TaxID=266040 RepID=A0ACB7SJ50_HYAAI|nr:hypothetical protein HPB50_019136 [Hyalomma asiaticum]